MASGRSPPRARRGTPYASRGERASQASRGARSPSRKEGGHPRASQFLVFFNCLFRYLSARFRLDSGRVGRARLPQPMQHPADCGPHAAFCFLRGGRVRSARGPLPSSAGAVGPVCEPELAQRKGGRPLHRPLHRCRSRRDQVIDLGLSLAHLRRASSGLSLGGPGKKLSKAAYLGGVLSGLASGGAVLRYLWSALCSLG